VTGVQTCALPISYLQIDQTDDPGDSAIDDWRRQERNGSWPGYKRIALRPTGDEPPVPDTDDGDDSADWEFTFDGENGRVRILNRGFVTDDHGYAILLRAPEKDFERVRAELRPVYEPFEPPPDCCTAACPPAGTGSRPLRSAAPCPPWA